ncbi:MerR family transcriptional regulator [Streptomyces sp. NPDC017179]|uniref:MerR family transcriptional regulator n=1 Tax=Streptomyces sp. NPDC017179 TaxID=3364979 RepID=UPI00378D480C
MSDETPPVAGLTTGALARRLGVSPTTLRSWDRRYGLGPAVREGGRHRRWSPQDIAMVEEMCRLTSAGTPPAEAARVTRLRRGGPPGQAEPFPAVPSARRASSSGAGEPPLRGGAGSGLPLGDVRQECRGLARAAVRLDAPELESRLLDAVRRYGLTVAWEEVMVPTLRAVGRKWVSSGERYVEVEHLLSWQVSTTLRSMPLLLPRAAVRVDVPPVVLACVPGEQHSLPLEALNAALGERGVPTRMLGAAVPVEALLACVRRTGPTAVVLWSQARSTASVPLARRIAALEWGAPGARGRPAVLPAGPGWERRACRDFPGCVGLRDAVGTLSRLCGGDGAAAHSARVR